MLEAVERILDALGTLPARIKTALRDLTLEGEQVLAEFADFPAGVGGIAAYGYVWNNREKLEKLEAWVGRVDAMLAIAQTRGICFPRFLKGEDSLVIRGLHHPNLETGSKTIAVCNDVAFDSGRMHVLLTGPNRGGKSTFCRSVGVAILCAQSWGFAWAKSMSFTPFNRIQTALHPADTLGKRSLFEAEIEFAKAVLADPAERAFIMMDEIFHSTNARDGIAASRVFLRQLYAKRGIVSVISTHYRELAEEFKDEVHAWAMEAKDACPDGSRLEYTYKVIPGISDKSSVMEILRERGLLDSRS
jgi:DNA mismatch repair ATPase MutS